MDIIRLGDPYNSSYTPDASPIEGLTSKIFTERWRGPGDFELKTPRVEYIQNLLPPDTLISHRETDCVMMVEEHEIEETSKGPVAIVKGRSLDFFTEHRFVEGAYQKKRKMRQKYPPASAVAVLLWQAFDNTWGKDVTYEGDKAWNTRDAIPNVAITDSTITTEGAKTIWLTEGSLGPQIDALLEQHDLGVRVIRPGFDVPVTVIIVQTIISIRGQIERLSYPSTQALRFDVYSGLDRTESQDVNPKVVFSVTQDHLKDPRFNFSSREYKTAVEIMSKFGSADIYRQGEATLTGLQRRVMAWDAGEPDIPPEPTPPEPLKQNATREQKKARADAMDKYIDDHKAWVKKYSDDIEEFKADSQVDGLRLLKKARRLSTVDGTITALAPYRYREHYNLGDKVTLYGSNKTTTDMVIGEYVRSEDATGDKGYPTLVAPTT